MAAEVDYESLLRHNKQYTLEGNPVSLEVLELSKGFFADETEEETKHLFGVILKKRKKLPKRKVKRIVDRKDPFLAESFHNQMEDLTLIGEG